MIINHPLLGPRDAQEFTYLGDAALINRPDWQAEDAAEQDFVDVNAIAVVVWVRDRIFAGVCHHCRGLGARTKQVVSYLLQRCFKLLVSQIQEAVWFLQA